LSSAKVVQVAHTFPPYMNGLSIVVEMLSRNLVESNIDVEVLTLDPTGKLKQEEEMWGIKVKRFSCLAPSNAYFIPSPKLLSYLESLKADVVHAHNVGSVLLPACSVAMRNRRNKLKKLLYVVSPHHHEAGSLWHTKFFWAPYKPLARYAIKSADAVHCVSKFEANKVVRDFQVGPVVIENGVDNDVYKYSWRGSDNDAINVIFVGRLEKYKRIDLIIRAVALVMHRGYDANVTIVGKGPELPSILKLAKKLEVRLSSFSNLPRRDLFELYSRSDCLVNCSMYEAFSLVTAEALAIGLPSVTVYPWGVNFEMYPRALVVAPDEDSVAAGIIESKNLASKPVVMPPTWKDVVRRVQTQIYKL
jgi:glycosyltransferase involved in cell wall biosynthesis